MEKQPTTQEEIAEALRKLGAASEKFIGPEEARQLDAEANARTAERFNRQTALHERSVVASERLASAMERIAELMAGPQRRE